MKTEDRTVLKMEIHKEDGLHRWLHGEKGWIIKIISIVFAMTLCITGVAFKDIRLAIMAGYSVYLFSQVLEWTRQIKHRRQNDFDILMTITVVPCSLTPVLMGAADPNMKEGLAWQGVGLVLLYSFSILKPHLTYNTTPPEA